MSKVIDHYIWRNGANIVLGIALENAVIDVLTDVPQLERCLQLLREPHVGLVDTRMGTFGDCVVTLNFSADDIVAIVIDGPYYERSRNQSSGIWPDKEDLERLLVEALVPASNPVVPTEDPTQKKGT